MESSFNETLSSATEELQKTFMPSIIDGMLQGIAIIFSQPITYIIIAVMILYVVASIIYKKKKKWKELYLFFCKLFDTI